MAHSRFLIALLAAAAAVPAAGQVVINSVVETFMWSDPFGVHDVPPGFEATCEAKKTFRASQHILENVREPLPLGLAPWAEAMPYFFGGRPFPGSWNGVDHRGTSRQITKMEYADVPEAVKSWIDKQDEDKEGDARYLFGVYEKPGEDGGKVTGTAKPRGQDGAVPDEDKVMFFAAGALYEIMPLWVAEGSDCEDELMNLGNYWTYPMDGKVVAWAVGVTKPDTEAGTTDIEFTIKAQMLRETEEGRETRLLREKEAEEARLQKEEEERLRAEEEAQAAEQATQDEGQEAETDATSSVPDGDDKEKGTGEESKGEESTGAADTGSSPEKDEL